MVGIGRPTETGKHLENPLHAQHPRPTLPQESHVR
jgi:hypothetical protein